MDEVRGEKGKYFSITQDGRRQFQTFARKAETFSALKNNIFGRLGVVDKEVGVIGFANCPEIR